MRKRTVSFALFFILSCAVDSFGSDFESRLKALEETIRHQGKVIEEQQRTINQLKEQLQETKKVDTAAAGATEVTEEKKGGLTGLFSGKDRMNPNISLVLNTFAYHSNLRESELEARGIPGYTAEGTSIRKGFTIDSAELFLFAPVDPYFNLYATIPVTEDGVELEEAYFVTTSLPAGLQLKGGKFKSGFGRINAQHPHQWDFVDIPLPYRAFTGEEGIIEKGAQLTVLPELPFYILLGFEVLQGQNEVLFGPDARSGPHAMAAFAKASVDIGDGSTLLFGPSVIAGDTKTGSAAESTDLSGDATLYGMELTYKWKPSKQRSLTLQSEYLYRTQKGDLSTLADDVVMSVESLKREQDGLYVQGVYQWGRWRGGARYDRLDLFKDNYSLGGAPVAFGKDPWRASGMLEFNPSESSRIRLQYTHDRAARNARANNELFLQFIFGIGAHAAHSF